MFYRIITFTKYCSFLIMLLSCGSQNKLEDTTSNIDIYYQMFGEGKPILIINGGPGMNSEGFVFIAKEIANLNYKTIIYDQRGTGKSVVEKPDTTNITLNLMVEDIEDLRKQLKLKKWIIFGHSFGGILATHYASKYPDKIEKIIFSSSGGMNLKFKNYIKSRINKNLSEAQQDSLVLYENDREKRLSIISNAYVYNKIYADEIAERLKVYNAAINQLVYQDLYKMEYDYTGDFTENEIPVLVIQGKDDVISIETAKEIADSFGNSRLVLLENCAHFGWLDSKEKYLNEIRFFLEGK